jgi:hypothetical protein
VCFRVALFGYTRCRLTDPSGVSAAATRKDQELVIEQQRDRPGQSAQCTISGE